MITNKEISTIRFINYGTLLLSIFALISIIISELTHNNTNPPFNNLMITMVFFILFISSLNNISQNKMLFNGICEHCGRKIIEVPAETRGITATEKICSECNCEVEVGN